MKINRISETDYALNGQPVTLKRIATDAQNLADVNGIGIRGLTEFGMKNSLATTELGEFLDIAEQAREVQVARAVERIEEALARFQ